MGEMAKPITHIPTTLQMGRRGHWGLNGRAVPHTHTYTDNTKYKMMMMMMMMMLAMMLE